MPSREKDVVYPSRQRLGGGGKEGRGKEKKLFVPGGGDSYHHLGWVPGNQIRGGKRGEKKRNLFSHLHPWEEGERGGFASAFRGEGGGMASLLLDLQKERRGGEKRKKKEKRGTQARLFPASCVERKE